VGFVHDGLVRGDVVDGTVKLTSPGQNEVS
jgi:hypothetical protein